MIAATKKTVIGLTGNIATGKTVVRKMLGHLGAYTIDADALTHRVMAKDGPGYKRIVELFGKFILDKEANIDRAKLAKVVFSDPEALASLEAIVHPYVRKAVDYLISKSKQDVVVVEAIKLLESPLREKIDSLWVTTSSEDNQLIRLATKRNMPAHEARQRMQNQTSQKEKIVAAEVVIENNGSFDDTWKQVQQAWQRLFPYASSGDTVRIPAEKIRAALAPAEPIDLSKATLEIDRARPLQAQQIADFINRMSGTTGLTRMDVMAAFGEKAYMLLYGDDQLAGVVGWQVENLVARIDEVWLDGTLDTAKALKTIVKVIEKSSKELQAEALLAFVDPEQAADVRLWQPMGYQILTIPQLEVSAWQEAARESQPPDTLILFKQLRVDQVLRPI